jgi:hypothetical protein
MSPSYKNRIGALASDSRRALVGIATGDRVLFIHTPIDLSENAQRNRLLDHFAEFWLALPSDPEIRAREVVRIDAEVKLRSGLGIERTAFFVLAAILKMETVSQTLLDYPRETQMAHLASELVQNNRALLGFIFEGNEHANLGWLFDRLPASRRIG